MTWQFSSSSFFIIILNLSTHNTLLLLHQPPHSTLNCIIFHSKNRKKKTKSILPTPPNNLHRSVSTNHPNDNTTILLPLYNTYISTHTKSIGKSKPKSYFHSYTFKFPKKLHDNTIYSSLSLYLSLGFNDS